MIDATDILAARILVVDDDPDAASTLAQVLTLHGYSCVATTTDPRAVHGMHRANDYDLILLDLQMPNMDGFAVMEGLREFERDGYLPVLAITGEPGHRMPALKLGAKDFLRKPVDPEELLLRVRNMIEVRLLYKDCSTGSRCPRSPDSLRLLRTTLSPSPDGTSRAQRSWLSLLPRRL